MGVGPDGERANSCRDWIPERQRRGGTIRINKYVEGRELSDTQLAAGAHRNRVGGHWDRIGELQFDLLREQGLTPQSYLLDVGCGALRGGVHFVRYLDPGHYFGIDVQPELVRAGLDHEIPAAGLADRLPASNVRVTDRFSCDFGVAFDFALAQSLFTHLPLNHIRLCLYRVAKVMRPGGQFFVTFFEAPPNLPYDQPQGKRYPEQDPYHYRLEELEWAAGVADWEFRYIGAWGHPRGQKVVEYRRKAPRSHPVRSLSRRVGRRAPRTVRRFVRKARSHQGRSSAR